jgi:hypothetical protein
MRSCNKNKMREVIAAAGWMRPHACIVCWRFARVCAGPGAARGTVMFASANLSPNPFS